MSRERELLERAIGSFDSNGFINNFVLEEIRAYLAEPEVKPQPFNQTEFDEMVRKGTEAWKDYKPEQDEEPVVWMKEDEDGDLEFNTLNQFSCGRTNGIPLYLHPAPRKPFVRLSEEEIMAIVRADAEFVRLTHDEVNSLMNRSLPAYELICAVENMLERKNRE